jgi:HPt (histidine-containing phosphotransfer) domain-containing protein
MTLDLDQLRNVCLGDDELMRELMSALIEDTGRQLELLHTALEQSNMHECARVAHYAKGACANLGAVSTARTLKYMESAAVRGDVRACGDSLQLLVGEFDRLREEAQRL